SAPRLGEKRSADEAGERKLVPVDRSAPREVGARRSRALLLDRLGLALEREAPRRVGLARPRVAELHEPLGARELVDDPAHGRQEPEDVGADERFFLPWEEGVFDFLAVEVLEEA